MCNGRMKLQMNEYLKCVAEAAMTVNVSELTNVVSFHFIIMIRHRMWVFPTHFWIRCICR